MTSVPPGYVIRDFASARDYADCVAIQDETWGSGFSERVPSAILKVAQYVGGVSAGAFDQRGEMAGFVFGLTGVRDGQLVHWSDMLAVRERHRGRHLGAALKEYQRHKVVAAGVQRMLWTFDPLVARNAHLNINRLGAWPVEYVPDMYGSATGSSLHGPVPTDRFVVVWDLVRRHQPVAPDAAAHAGDDILPLANPVGHDGLPRVNDVAPEASVSVRVQIPNDLRDEQRDGSERARQWRMAVRNAILPRLQSGFRVARFVPALADRLPYYVLSRVGV